MSSRLARTLLALYPRRVRRRYGDELLALESELRARGEVTRARVVRDMLAGALLVRRGRRRARMVGVAVLAVAGLTVGWLAVALASGGGTRGGARGAGTSAGALVARARPVGTLRIARIENAPVGESCFIDAGSTCSLTACTEFIDGITVYRIGGPARIAGASMRCAAYPNARARLRAFASG